MDKPTSLDQFVPLHIGWHECERHVHLMIGVTSVAPPEENQYAVFNENEGVFFYPQGEVIVCNS